MNGPPLPCISERPRTHVSHTRFIDTFVAHLHTILLVYLEFLWVDWRSELRMEFPRVAFCLGISSIKT